MKKIAFLFPGQGAQYIGMAMDFVKKDPEFKKILTEFDKKNKTNLFQIMKEGPLEDLKKTKYTQPAILFHSIVAMRSLIAEIDIKPDFVAGHSLGEFSALVANGVLNFEDAMYLVHKRGEFMIVANEDQPFAMSVILGSDVDTVKQICKKASQEGIVVAANFNTPVQTVISGTRSGVEKANELLKKEGAKRIIPLKVGGPFHSPLIKKAGIWLSEEMKNFDFRKTNIPVISNVSALPETNPKKLRENLTKQVTSSVLWVDSIKYLLEQSIEIFIEFGPKKVLAGMMKKIDRKAKVLSIDSVEDLDNIKQELRKNV